MIHIHRRQFGISYSYIWFADRPAPARAFLPTVYMNCRYGATFFGFVKRPQYTKLVDLRRPREDLLANFGKNTSYKIRRAEREGVVVVPVESAQDFVAFYNEFATSKDRPLLDLGQVPDWGRSTVGFAAMDDHGPQVMHSYVLDRQASRARLLHSASLFRNLQDSKERNAVGRANRFLHFKAMTAFAEEGLATYDFGGYAKDTLDADLAKINAFKDEFGGELVEETSFTSYPMQFLKALRSGIA